MVTIETCISIALFQTHSKRAVSPKRFQQIRTVLKRPGLAARLSLAARLLRLPLKGGVILGYRPQTSFT